MIDAAGYRRLAAVAEALGAPLAPQTQHNLYFDTAERALGGAGMMLRVRLKGGAYELTLKIRRAMDDGAMVAEEINAPLPDGLGAQLLASAALSGVEGTAPWSALVEALGGAPDALQRQGTLTTRRALLVTPQGYALEIDHSEYAGCEDWEVECETEDLEAARAVIVPWLESEGVYTTPAVKTKVGRMFAALDGAA